MSGETQQDPSAPAEIDLDKMMSETRVIQEELPEKVLHGHPADVSLPGASGDDGKKDEDKTQQSSPAQPDPEADKPNLDPEKDQDQQDQEKPKFRFKGHAEAEEGYRNLQAQHTTIAQELANYKRREQAARDAQTQATADADFKVRLREHSKKSHAEAQAKIDQLDPDSDQYHEQVAEILAERDVEIADFMSQARPARQAPADPAVPTPSNSAGQAQQSVDPWKYAKTQAAEVGIEEDDPFFLERCKTVPAVDKDGKPRYLEDMVEQVIKETKEYHQRLEARVIERQKKKAAEIAGQHQELSMPMGGSPAPQPRQAEKRAPVGINDVLSLVAAERRI